MDQDDELIRIASLLVLDRQPTEDLPDIATDALVRGIDSPSLRVLAGTSTSDVRDARDLFWQAFDELGFEQPTSTKARWSLVMRWAADIEAGRIEPVEGARMIWWEGWEELDRPDQLTAFVGLVSEWEDDPANRQAYDEDIRSASRRLLGNAAESQSIENEGAAVSDVAIGHAPNEQSR